MPAILKIRVTDEVSDRPAYLQEQAGDVCYVGDPKDLGFSPDDRADPNYRIVKLPLINASDLQFLVGWDYPQARKARGPNRFRFNRVNHAMLKTLDPRTLTLADVQALISSKAPYQGANLFPDAVGVIG